MAGRKTQKIPAKKVKQKKQADWPYDYDIHGMPLDPNHFWYQPGNLYLKYPNGYPPVSETLTSPELDRKINLYMEGYFMGKEDPLIAIQCLLLCHKKGLYPPEVLMRFSMKGLQRFWESRGKIPLERCLGLVGPYSVQKRLNESLGEERRKRETRYYNFWWDVWCWQLAFHLSYARAIQVAGPYHGFSADSLHKRYSHPEKHPGWHKVRTLAKYHFEDEDLERYHAKEGQVYFLSKYPLSYLDTHLFKVKNKEGEHKKIPKAIQDLRLLHPGSE